MSEAKPVPKTKEELIAMLKEQLDKVEVPSFQLRMISVPCRAHYKTSEKRGVNLEGNLKKKRKRFKNS